MINWALILCIFISVLDYSALAQEKSEAFEVRAYSDRYKVIAPPKFQKGISLILENRTLVRIYGKVVSNKRKVIEHVSILPGKFKSVKLGLKKGEIASFIPLSPSFQEVKLILGRRPYEIPPKK